MFWINIRFLKKVSYYAMCFFHREMHHGRIIQWRFFFFLFPIRKCTKRKRNVNQLPCKLSRFPFGPCAGASNFLEIYLLSVLLLKFPGQIFLDYDKSNCIYSVGLKICALCLCWIFTPYVSCKDLLWKFLKNINSYRLQKKKIPTIKVKLRPRD